ncbi:MAG TPA: hypothetical protein ENK43_10285 [Planctomycetes bacterium]|nr:hypothetical protein [Planctomycetota bacterium]
MCRHQVLFCILLVVASRGFALGQESKAPAKIVFVTGDEEYRSEESMPMLAAILERDFGFRCPVAYALTDAGEIDPNRLDHIDGLDELKDADLMVLFTRFRRLPDDELKKILDYAESGRPLVGFRTATHAFRYPKGDPRAARMNERWPTKVFGQHWITHHGHFKDGHGRLTAVTPLEKERGHPVLRGVDAFLAYSWLYHVQGGGDRLSGDSRPLVLGWSLRSNHAGRLDRFPRETPVAWVKSYTGGAGKKARVFFTTLGHPYDFKIPSMRRLALNGILWALGREDLIPEGGCRTDTVKPYDPPNSGFGKVYRAGVFPRRPARGGQR